MTAEKEQGKYLWSSKSKQDLILSHMKSSGLYTQDEIESIFDDKEVKLVSLHYLIGALVSNDIFSQKIKFVIIEKSKNESEFRNFLVNSNSKKLEQALESLNIKKSQIESTESIEFDPTSFNFHSFLSLVVSKKDQKSIDILCKRKKSD